VASGLFSTVPFLRRCLFSFPLNSFLFSDAQGNVWSPKGFQILPPVPHSVSFSPHLPRTRSWSQNLITDDYVYKNSGPRAYCSPLLTSVGYHKAEVLHFSGFLRSLHMILCLANSRTNGGVLEPPFPPYKILTSFLGP